MAEKVNFASVIANRGFRFLWLNQILVQLGDNALNFALIIWVYKLTNSNLAVSGLLLAIYLPVILFGVFAGVAVDLADRRKVIILVDILLAIVFLMFIPIKASYPLILVNTFIRNCLVQFFMPAESSAIPLLVSKRQLILANSLFSLTLYAAFMIGFTAGGPILNAFGINLIFFAGAVLLTIASFAARQLPVIRTAGAPLKFRDLLLANKLQGMVDLTIQEVKDITLFIRGKLSVAASIGLLSAVQGLVGVLAVISPAYLERVLHIHATDASYFVMLPLGLGIVLGALSVGRWLHSLPRRSVVIPAVVVAGIIFILIGLVPEIARLIQSPELPELVARPRYFFRAPSLSLLFSLMAFILGFATALINVPSQTVLQEATPEEDRGKLFAVLAVIMTAASAVPVVLAGGLADIFGPSPIYVGLGVVILAVGCFAWRPGWFFKKGNLPFRFREFLGLDHWKS